MPQPRGAQAALWRSSPAFARIHGWQRRLRNTPLATAEEILERGHRGRAARRGMRISETFAIPARRSRDTLMAEFPGCSGGIHGVIVDADPRRRILLW